MGAVHSYWFIAEMTAPIDRKEKTVRLIDADALPRLTQIFEANGKRREQEVVLSKIIDNAPTIDAVPATIDGTLGYLHKVGWMQEHDRIMAEDVAPVRHGIWVDVDRMQMHDLHGVLTWGNSFKCTECQFKTFAVEGHITQYKYCPNCGAKMDEGDSNED